MYVWGVRNMIINSSPPARDSHAICFPAFLPVLFSPKSREFCAEARSFETTVAMVLSLCKMCHHGMVSKRVVPGHDHGDVIKEGAIICTV